MATIEITVLIGCKLNCSYCPQELISKKYNGQKFLSFENFKTFLFKIPTNVRIDFSGMAEPFLNNETIAMIKLAIDNGYKIAIFTTLVGLNKDSANELMNLLVNNKDSVEILSLHLPDNSGNMRGWKYNDEYFYILSLFLNNKFAFKDFRIMTMDENNEVHRSISSLINLENKWKGIDRAGALEKNNTKNLVIESYRHDYAVECKLTPYYDHNVLLPNGDVLLCCMDYGLRHIFGNLLKDNYQDLFQSKALNHLKDINIKNEFSRDSICKNCNNAVCKK